MCLRRWASNGWSADPLRHLERSNKYFCLGHINHIERVVAAMKANVGNIDPGLRRNCELIGGAASGVWKHRRRWRPAFADRRGENLPAAFDAWAQHQRKQIKQILRGFDINL